MMLCKEVELGCVGSMHQCTSGSELVGWTYMS